MYAVELKNENDIVLWSSNVDDSQLCAGMMAVGLPIIATLNEEKKSDYYLDTDADISDFRVKHDYTEDIIKSIRISKEDLLDNELAIWIKSDIPFYYNLFKFTNSTFIQGAISMCNAFDVDFRNYFYGLPFDRAGTVYELDKYTLPLPRPSIDIPDLDDVDEDEREDENITQPFEEDDYWNMI